VFRFYTVCKDCEQKERNERKNVDRPLAIVRQRAAGSTLTQSHLFSPGLFRLLSSGPGWP